MNILCKKKNETALDLKENLQNNEQNEKTW